MSLEALPNELLFLIAELLSTQRDLNSFAQTSRRLHAHVDPFLYRRNVKSGKTSALNWAAEIGREDTAIRALDAGAHVNAIIEPQEGHTALHIACANGHLNVVSILLARDAYIHVTTSKDLNALHVACVFKQAPIVELLLAHGTRINTPSGSQETALHYALKAPHLKSLLHHRPGPTWPQKTSTYHRRNPPPPGSTLSTISLLLSHGADPLARDRGGASPETLAKQHPDPEVRALIRHAAASARERAAKVDARIRDRTARRHEAREKESVELERQERQERLARLWEEEEAQKARERERDERCAREKEAERRREERLRNARQVWSLLREGAEKRDCRGFSGALRSRGSSSSWSATSTGCKHTTSVVWLKRRGKGQCELCSKACAKHSFQCSDCGLVACSACKAKFLPA